MGYSKRRQCGATLIEVLISLLVIAIGMLGIAGMQVAQMRQVSQAAIEYMVNQQINDIADRMRANPAGVEANLYNNIDANSGNPAINCEPTAAQAVPDCSIEDMAAFDATQWNAANAALMPNGTGTVTRNGTDFIITLNWNASFLTSSVGGAGDISCTGTPGNMTCTYTTGITL